jgi:hypothetical protein
MRAGRVLTKKRPKSGGRRLLPRIGDRTGSDHKHTISIRTRIADGDLKTVEILSKALLLARDQDIKDPTILEQIRR